MFLQIRPLIDGRQRPSAKLWAGRFPMASGGGFFYGATTGATEAHLDEFGVTHSPVRELGHSCFASLADPGVQIELWLTITPRRPAASR